MLVGVSGGIALGAVINIIIERTTSGPSTPEEVFGDAAPAPGGTQDGAQDDESKSGDAKVRDGQTPDARDRARDARDGTREVGEEVRDGQAGACDARDEKGEAENAEMK